MTTVYYQWNQLGGITQTIAKATLTVNVPNSQGGADGAVVTLYRTTDNNMPPTGLGAALGGQTLPNPATYPLLLTYDETTNAPGLASYLDGARAGGTATVALQISNCSGFVANIEPASTATLALQNSTAVTLTTFRAADPALSRPLVPVAAGLVALVVVLAVVLRRRVMVRAR